MEILKQRSINPKRVDIMINSYWSKTKRMEVDIKITNLYNTNMAPTSIVNPQPIGHQQKQRGRLSAGLKNSLYSRIFLTHFFSCGFYAIFFW